METFEVKIGNEIKKLIGIVFFKRGFHFNSNERFDIFVWGNTKHLAEEAFAFMFQALYQNFALENDDNLTPSPVQLKQSLLSCC
jgi:hypothetical protein